MQGLVLWQQRRSEEIMSGKGRERLEYACTPDLVSKRVSNEVTFERKRAPDIKELVMQTHPGATSLLHLGGTHGTLQ